MLMTALVTAAGYDINVVANGVEAVEAVRNRPYGLVLMDIQMPEMDGIEATRQIRLLSNDNASIPIIGVTAYAMKGDQERFMQAGMNDYMSKPIDTKLLSQRIGFWMGDDELGAGELREAPLCAAVRPNSVMLIMMTSSIRVSRSAYSAAIPSAWKVVDREAAHVLRTKLAAKQLNTLYISAG